MGPYPVNLCMHAGGRRVTDPWLFLVAIVALLAAPGPTNVLLATGGALAGFRRALPLLGAELAGYALAVGLIRLVLVPLTEDRPAFGVAIKVVVAIYLIWLAIRLWRSRQSAAEPAGVVRFSSVLVATLLNPKSLVVASTLVPWSMPTVTVYLAGCATIVVATGAAWIRLGAALGAAAGDRMRWLPRIAAVVLTGLAGLVAASAI